MQRNAITEKMKNALITSKDFNAERALKVMKSDMFRLLSDYFSFQPQNLKLTANLLQGGEVSLVVTLKAENFKEAGKTLD